MTYAPKIPGIGRAAVTLSLVAGIVLTMRGEIGTLNGAVTGWGGGHSLAMETPRIAAEPAEAMLTQGDLHGAASFVPAYEAAAAGRMLALGVLLIALGGFLHAFLTATYGERQVRISEAPLPPPAALPSQTEDLMPFERIRMKSEKKYYWMEIKV